MLESFPEGPRAILLAPLIGAPVVEMAGGQFAYATRAAVDDVFTTTWLLDFFAAAVFIGITSPTRDQDAC